MIQNWAREGGIAKPEGHGAEIEPIWNAARRRVRKDRRPSVFLYSHDTYGLGHLRRNLAIAEHLLNRSPSFSVRLLTGSPVIASWDIPEGLAVTALPPVVKTGVETYAPRESSLPFGLVKAYREALILKAVIEEAPDIFLVDHAPAGMNAELLSTLAFIRRELPHTHVVLGMRDILDCPETVRRIWQEQGIIPLLDNLYDRIFVYGCRELLDVVAGYGIPPHIADRVTYCGYIARPTQRATATTGHPRRVLVTAGGGEDGLFLMEAYLRALAQLPPGVTQSRIVTGPLMPAPDRAILAGLAEGRGDVEILRSTPDLPSMLAETDLVVAMGGYNTSVEIVASGTAAILVPRAAPRAEQRMRAAMLEKMGLVWAVEPGEGLTQRLAARLEAALAGQRPIPLPGGLDLDGAARVAALFDAIVGADGRALEAS